MLILSRKVNETIVVGDEIEVKVLEVSGERVKIGITAPREISIVRQELLDDVEAENVAAVGPEPATVADLAKQLRKSGAGSER